MFIRRQAAQQLAHSLALAGQDELRCDLAERFEHKPSKMRSWMRQLKPRGVPDFVPKRDEVEVERAGFIEDDLGLAAKFLFECL